MSNYKNSKVTTLNPHAPEYYPIPPGISPNPNAPLPPFLRRRPPPHFPPPPRFSQTHHFSPAPLWIPDGAHANYNAAPRDRSAVRRIPRPPPRPRRFARHGGDRRNAGAARCMQKNPGSRRNDHQVTPLDRDDLKTTVMIKNIPYDCPRGDLMSLVDGFCLAENGEGFVSAYDFLYLPIDFRTKKSRGFAFVNFTSAATVWRFFQAYNSKSWGPIRHAPNWTKKIEIVAAKIQGKAALVNHFSKSYFECETDEYLPVSFEPARDGSGQDGQVTAIGIRRERGRAAVSRWGARRNH